MVIRLYGFKWASQQKQGGLEARSGYWIVDTLEIAITALAPAVLTTGIGGGKL